MHQSFQIIQIPNDAQFERQHSADSPNLVCELGKLTMHHSWTCWHSNWVLPFLPQLEERVLDWQSSPASSLNSWFSAAPNWAELVLPALQYLAGESRGKISLTRLVHFAFV